MTTTAHDMTESSLALHGGPKAMGPFRGREEPKIGVAEFFSIARRFGFSDAAQARLEAAVTDADLPDGGPVLARFVTTRPQPAFGELYEAKARRIFGSAHALSTSSGTGALHAAMVAVGAGPGKEVVVPALGFMATAMAVALSGATPVFCDVDESLQMDPTKLEACITPATIAVVPTHHWGIVADLDPILAIARARGLKVIEDCAQSPGARYKGRLVGTIGDIGCFSIAAYKIVGGGEGGLLLTDHEKFYIRACQLAESGGLWRKDRCAPPQHAGELFVGTNYRFSELEAAVDLVQLDKMPGIVERYHRNYHRVVGQLLRTREIQPQRVNDAEGLIGYSLRFFPESQALQLQLRDALVAEGLDASIRQRPDWHLCTDMYPLAAILGPNSHPERCTVGEDLYTREIALNIGQGWDAEDCQMVAAAINKVLTALCTVDSQGPAWL